MQTTALKGNILTLHVALALNEQQGVRHTIALPWNDWANNVFRWESPDLLIGGKLGPFDAQGSDDEISNMLAVFPLVSRWALRSEKLPGGRWVVSTPAGESFMADNLVHGYAIALISGVLGAEVSDWYFDPQEERYIYLPPYNVDFGEPGVNPNAPKMATFVPPADCTTYGTALLAAKHLLAKGEVYRYTCDGHSWVQVHLMDGSAHTLYQGASTIGLSCTPEV